MTLRIAFTRDDLQQVRLAGAADPMWEVVLSLHQLREREAVTHGHWRSQVHRELRHGTPAWLGTMCTLVPPRGSFPDFLTPGGVVVEAAAGYEALACTTPARLRTDLASTFATRPAPGWVRELASGGRDELRQVVDAMREAHGRLVEPHWAEVHNAVSTDLALRTRKLAAGGVSALLSSLPAVRRWDGETLELAYPVSRTLRLAGRGLTLVPSYFCTSAPVTLVDPALRPVLIYPAVRAPRAAVTAELVTLLGQTRAATLGALVTARTTSALADELGVSVATASRQASTLRAAGLVTSTRRGGAIVHHVTRLGAALLAGDVV